jgi:hypothetical protein
VILTDANESWPFNYCYCNTGGAITAGWYGCATAMVGNCAQFPADCAFSALTFGGGQIAILYVGNCGTTDPITGHPTFTVTRYWLLAEAHLQLYYLCPPYDQGSQAPGCVPAMSCLNLGAWGRSPLALNDICVPMVAQSWHGAYCTDSCTGSVPWDSCGDFSVMIPMTYTAGNCNGIPTIEDPVGGSVTVTQA